jgi:hypothetical protein
MNLQKLFLIALLGAAVSATTVPTLSKVIGFGHSAAFAQDSQGDDNGQGDQNVDDMGEDGNSQ